MRGRAEVRREVHGRKDGLIKAGDAVVFKVLPPWVEAMPEKSRRVFRFRLGRAHRVSEIDSNGLLVLDASKDIDHRFGGSTNDIRLEAEFVAKTEAHR